MVFGCTITEHNIMKSVAEQQLYPYYYTRDVFKSRCKIAYIRQGCNYVFLPKFRSYHAFDNQDL